METGAGKRDSSEQLSTGRNQKLCTMFAGLGFLRWHAKERERERRREYLLPVGKKRWGESP